MRIERIRPEVPSSAPATINSLLSSTKPIAEAERPAYAFRIAITVGMSAPPIGMISRTPNKSDATINTNSDRKCAGIDGQIRSRDHSVASSTDVDEVPAGVDDRTRGHDLLQLAERHQAAGEGQKAEQHLERERDMRERGDVRRMLVILGEADECRGQTAERVRQRGSLWHRRHRHHQRHRQTDRRADHERDRNPGVALDAETTGDDRADHGQHHAAVPAQLPRRAVLTWPIHFSAKMNSAAEAR